MSPFIASPQRADTEPTSAVSPVAGATARLQQVATPVIAPAGGRAARRLEASSPTPAPALLCFSHLRWDFVFQRPQHLLTRFARHQPVYVIEEPFFGPGPARLEISRREHGLRVVTPHLENPAASEEEQHHLLRILLDRMLEEQGIGDYLLWFYTPMALPFTNHLRPLLVVYDCMDELSAFAGAPPVMRARERQLMAWADLVFTGGHSLYAAKRDCHPQVHAFPSSIDREHFAQALQPTADPHDQAPIAGPRIGFFGVIDERFDIALLDGLAQARPDWHFVIIGPVVKIDPATLPRHANIHYLGKKCYRELPTYLAGWDVAMLPFARNESTRYISPTKTPEYLSAGRPVVSTSIADVVHPYGEQGLVRIADDVAGFCAAIGDSFSQVQDPCWQREVATFLGGISWDDTWQRMRALMVSVAASKGHAGEALVPRS